MEEVRSIVNRRLILMLLAICLSTASCKQCKQCEELPAEVTHLQGEWEWFMTIRSTEIGHSLDFDYITPTSTNSSVRAVFEDEGTMKFYINDAEHIACVTMREYRFFDIPGELANYDCAESNNVGLIGDNLNMTAAIIIYGPSCNELDTLKGPRVPYNVNSSFLTSPPLPAGHELQGYTNYFKRIR